MSFHSFATVDQGGATEISTVHPDVIQTQILSRLDGPTLATAGCASSQLRALSTDDKLWQDICNHTWPTTTDLRRLISTFPSGHRSFFSDSFPTLDHYLPSETHQHRSPLTSELISAVDIHYQDRLILSKIHETKTETGWFLISPFRVDLLDPKETVPTPVKLECGEEKCRSDLEDNLTLSWILIDPTHKRAANFSSMRPVSVNRHWLTGDIQVRYATIISGEQGGDLVQYAAVVRCGGKEGGELEVKEVGFEVEDMEGKSLMGKESLELLQEAIKNGKRRKGKRGEEEKKRYENYLKMKRERRERDERRARKLEMACAATCVTIFLAWAFLLLRIYS